MQKQKCREFAAQMGWVIVNEFYEKGVSGYKLSAKQRDSIQEIQQDAVQGKFDVLLVFMFDRLGRKDDETPFVVEWFVRNGIEVWSTEEGEQRFDTHVDKLMNYIRYWQASGESLKTSIRTKTRLGQIVQEGRFRGGHAPYGYQLVKKGRIGKRNRELYDIEINPEEAPAVKQMYDLAERFGYGGRKISTELKHAGVINLRSGEPFHYASIQAILRNIMYVGILRSGETRSEIFPELQIITPEQFERVQKAREQRSKDYALKCGAQEQTITLEDGTETTIVWHPQNYPRRNTGKTLLSGNIYCGHCGGRIFASTARKSHHPTSVGKYERVSIYKCYNRSQHRDCDGPSSYRAGRIDEIVGGALRDLFSRAKAVKVYDLIDHQAGITIAQRKQDLQRAKSELGKNLQELSRW